MSNKYNFSWIWKQSSKIWWMKLLMIVTAVLSGVAAIFITNVIQTFVDKAGGNNTSSYKQIIIYALVVVVSYGALIVLSSVLDSYFFSITSKKMKADFIDSVYRKKNIEIESIHSGELLTRFTVDIDECAKIVPHLLGNASSELLLSIMAIVYVFILNWKMAITIFITIPLLIFLSGLVAPKVERIKKIDLENEEIHRGFAQDLFANFTLFKTYKMRAYSVGKSNDIYSKKQKTKIELGILEGLMGFVGNCMGFGLLIITMGIGSYLVIKGETTTGELIAMIQLTNYIMLPLSHFSGWTASIGESLASAKRIGAIYDLENDTTIDLSAYDEIEQIIFENVSFSYDKENDKPSLENVSFDLKKNTIVGIIGESGSGKTTLTKLIMGLYQPDSGIISFKHISGDEIRSGFGKFISYMPCDKFTFTGSVRENVVMSDEEIPDAEILNMAEKLKLTDLADGQGSIIDYLIEEDGKNISLGQGQRIAMMRALLHKNSVLILDEPTANLDEDSKQSVRELIRNISESRMCIVVTHDASVIEMCDEVYKVENNRVKKLEMEEK